MSTLAHQEFEPPYRQEYVRVPAGEVELALFNGWAVICDDEDGSGAVLMSPPVVCGSAAERSEEPARQARKTA